MNSSYKLYLEVKDGDSLYTGHQDLSPSSTLGDILGEAVTHMRDLETMGSSILYAHIRTSGSRNIIYLKEYSDYGGALPWAD